MCTKAGSFLVGRARRVLRDEDQAWFDQAFREGLSLREIADGLSERGYDIPDTAWVKVHAERRALVRPS